MQRDLLEINAYKDNVMVIKSNVMKEADALPTVPGFNAQQVYQRGMDLALIKNGVPIQNIEDFDLSRSYVNEVIDEGYAGLNIGQKGMLESYSKNPETRKMQIVTRDPDGKEFMTKGEAKFNPRFQHLTYDETTGSPIIGMNTIPITTLMVSHILTSCIRVKSR